MNDAVRPPAGGGTPGAHVVEMFDVDRDLDAWMAIEAASFFNHSTREAIAWDARNSPVARLFVLRGPAGDVVACCAAWLIGDELHINTFAVLPERRGRGLGSCLLRGVLASARREGATRATLEVRISNAPARRLYARHGFTEAAVRRGYYTSPSEDGLILWLDITQPDSA